MANNRIDITGTRHAFLIAVKAVRRGQGGTIWRLRCDCGRMTYAAASRFRKGLVKSCGCQRYKQMGLKHRTHGMSRSRPWVIWRNMRRRCGSPRDPGWKNYGAKGIRVCARWRASFSNFWKDMGPTYVEGLTIERKNSRGNYTPKNCTWATWIEQASNRGSNVFINTPWGKMTISAAARTANIGTGTLGYRVAHGWPVSRLFIRPSFTN